MGFVVSAASLGAAPSSGHVTNKDFTRRFPNVMSALLELPDIVTDGEVVALDKDGKRAFNLLQGLVAKRRKSCSGPTPFR